MKARFGLTVFMVLAVAGIVGAVDQPMMQAARGDLQTAKHELQMATPDKGGHRAKALALINDAIAEVNAGIAFDRRHSQAAGVGSKATFAGTVDQPHMQAALTALESAKNDLDRANADKGGHRAKAIDLVKDAISKVKKGIEAGRS